MPSEPTAIVAPLACARAARRVPGPISRKPVAAGSCEGVFEGEHRRRRTIPPVSLEHASDDARAGAADVERHLRLVRRHALQHETHGAFGVRARDQRLQHIVRLNGSRDGRRRQLADACAADGGGAHAPARPHRGGGDLRRVCRDRRRRRADGCSGIIDHVEQGALQRVSHDRRAAIESLAERRLGGVKRSGGACPGRAVAGEEEHRRDTRHRR